MPAVWFAPYHAYANRMGLRRTSTHRNSAKVRTVVKKKKIFKLLELKREPQDFHIRPHTGMLALYFIK
jgi:hypothetical protein